MYRTPGAAHTTDRLERLERLDELGEARFIAEVELELARRHPRRKPSQLLCGMACTLREGRVDGR